MSYRVPGLTMDASRGGLCVLIRHPSQVVWQEATIRIPKDFELMAQPVHQEPWTTRVIGSRVGFEIRRFVNGEAEWAAMYNGANGSQEAGG
jgi:hypothetical protein